MPPRRPLALLGAVTVFFLAALVAPPGAGAHVRTGVMAVDYRVRVLVQPSSVLARVYLSDRAVRLRARPGHEVVVLGYQGEPFLRLASDGVQVNQSSLTAAGVGFAARPRPGRPGPVWRLRSRTASVTWHDARVRGLPAGVVRGEWAIPLVVDGRRARLAGELVRVPRPSVWAWVALGVPFILAVALLLVRRRRRELALGAAAFGLGASACMIVADGGFAFDTYASEGKWLEFGNVLVFALVGAAFAVRGSLERRAIAGGALGLLALSVGLSKIPLFLHGVVLSVLSGGLARAVVSLTIWGGATATIVGGAVFFELL